MKQIWTEKYRPMKIDDIKGQDAIRERLKAYVRGKSIPNLLFAGPAGTGKTTGAIALANELFPGGWRQNFLELNASDERGINVVREKIKDFAKTSSFGGEVKFKIIFLDESDALTSPAQHALRRTMEKYTEGCRFILSCNYSSKIIDPIQSRCALFRFPRIKNEAVKEHLQTIAEKEEVMIEEEGLDVLLEYAAGDMRRAITMLQAVVSYKGKVDAEGIYKVFSIVDPGEIKKILDLVISGDFIKGREMLTDLMVKNGLSGLDVVKSIHKEIFNLSIDNETKMDLIDKLAEFEFRMVEGANEMIQLEALLANIALQTRTGR